MTAPLEFVEALGQWSSARRTAWQSLAGIVQLTVVGLAFCDFRFGLGSAGMVLALTLGPILLGILVYLLTVSPHQLRTLSQRICCLNPEARAQVMATLWAAMFRPGMVRWSLRRLRRFCGHPVTVVVVLGGKTSDVPDLEPVHPHPHVMDADSSFRERQWLRTGAVLWGWRHGRFELLVEVDPDQEPYGSNRRHPARDAEEWLAVPGAPTLHLARDWDRLLRMLPEPRTRRLSPPDFGLETSGRL